MTRMLTFGSFHNGHTNVPVRAKGLGNELNVSVSSDALKFSKKRNPVNEEKHKMQEISSTKYVDHVFVEE